MVAKQSSKVCTAPLIHSGLYPVASGSHVRVVGSFLLYQSEGGCRSAQPGAMSAALVWFYREQEKCRGRFGDLLEIFSSPIKEPCMYFQLIWRRTKQENWPASERYNSIYSMIHRLNTCWWDTEMEFISFLVEGATQVGKAQKNKTVKFLTFFYSSFTFKL